MGIDQAGFQHAPGSDRANYWGANLIIVRSPSLSLTVLGRNSAVSHKGKNERKHINQRPTIRKIDSKVFSLSVILRPNHFTSILFSLSYIKRAQG